MENIETVQARHRKEQRDLQSRITSKKKNATKKTRKGVNDECARLEQDLKQRQEREIAALNGDSQEATPAPEDDIQSNDEETNTVTQQLKTTTPSTATEPTQSQPQPQPQPQPQAERSPAPDAASQGEAGKKRNRQKERMARRAAEQEAAAVAAEEEAANMTDHRKIEKTYLLKEFAANGLVEKEIQPDGHCLFSAVADQLEDRGIPLVLHGNNSSSKKEEQKGEEEEEEGVEEGKGSKNRIPPYRIVRKAATDYMEAHPDDFAPFLEEPLPSYVGKIRDTAEWGGQIELLALASAYRVEIRVLQDGRTETVEPAADGDGDGDGDGVGGRKKIWLAYYRHGYGLGEHYNSLRKAG
ncbi:OTU domain-containing protein 6B [Xylariomycetidae sp. FL2044]|nr:OTU domain-containing protein 6B [Xylariomycetidae sp. FL2044]